MKEVSIFVKSKNLETSFKALWDPETGFFKNPESVYDKIEEFSETEFETSSYVLDDGREIDIMLEFEACVAYTKPYKR